MKTRLFLVSLLASVLFFACEDSGLDDIGMSMRPPQDYIQVYDTLMNVGASTVRIDSIAAKSNLGYLGSYYDLEYGEINAGYLSQFYPSYWFSADSMVMEGKEGREIDSVYLDIYFDNYFGDSITPMEVTAYKIINSIKKNLYTNLNPDDYADMTQAIGRLPYTSRNLTVSDSLNEVYGYSKVISIPLDRQIGQDIYEKFKANGNQAPSESDFINNWFKGIYLESSFGSGSIIEVKLTEMRVFYTRYYAELDTTTNEDVIKDDGIAAAVFTSTNEVAQLNAFGDSDDSKLLEPSEDKIYLKTPVGVYSKLVIPLAEIRKTIGNRKFSGAQLSIEAYEVDEDAEWTLGFPGVAGASNTSTPRLLLIQPDSLNTFFNNISVADSKTTYTANYNATTGLYNFYNISNLLQYAIDNIEDPNEDLELLLIPVMVESYAYSSSSTYYIDYATYHYMRPSAVTLKKGKGDLQIKLVASDLEINQ